MITCYDLNFSFWNIQKIQVAPMTFRNGGNFKNVRDWAKFKCFHPAIFTIENFHLTPVSIRTLKT